MPTILGQFSPLINFGPHFWRLTWKNPYFELVSSWTCTNIKTAQSTDPTCIDGLTKADDGISKWTIDDDGLLWQNNCLWIPNALDLQLQILQYHHNHIVSGHFGQNRTLSNICWEYVVRIHPTLLLIMYSMRSKQVAETSPLWFAEASPYSRSTLGLNLHWFHWTLVVSQPF